VYLSDHGEEVYDWRDQCARDHGPLSSNKLKYQYDIPFMVWCSDQFKHKHPEVVSRIRQAVNRPFMIDNLCHLLFTVGGINTVYYRDSLDLFSPRYNCKQRRVNNQDYDEIRWGR
jgi:heptose-I-phosphate ethanolaminephosphotransferase